MHIMTSPLNDHTDIKGHFHFDALDKISDGKYVSYSNNRLVFYLDDHVGTTFTGYVRCLSFILFPPIQSNLSWYTTIQFIRK